MMRPSSPMARARLGGRDLVCSVRINSDALIFLSFSEPATRNRSSQWAEINSVLLRWRAMLGRSRAARAEGRAACASYYRLAELNVQFLQNSSVTPVCGLLQWVHSVAM